MRCQGSGQGTRAAAALGVLINTPGLSPGWEHWGGGLCRHRGVGSTGSTWGSARRLRTGSEQRDRKTQSQFELCIFSDQLVFSFSPGAA